MVTPAMRELVRAGAGAGELDADASVRGAAEHPVCGDELQLDLRLDDDVIAALAWRAAGCPATLAVAAVAARALPGGRVAEAPARLRAELARLGGLARHEQHAEQLLLRALAAAAEGAGD